MRSKRWSSQGAASTCSTRRPQAGASGSSPTIGARRAGPTLPDRRAPRGWPARQNPRLSRGVGGQVRGRLGTGSFLPSPTVLPALAFSSASGVRSPGVAPRGPLRRLGILSRLGRAPGALYAARRGSSPPSPSPLAPSAHPVRIPAPCTTPPRRRPRRCKRLESACVHSVLRGGRNHRQSHRQSHGRKHIRGGAENARTKIRALRAHEPANAPDAGAEQVPDRTT